MSEPYIGEIKMTGYNFAQQGWALCDGQLLPINNNQALFSILGTTYGGDGETTFGLPDLRGRVPIHEGQHTGSNFRLGQKGGQESHILTANEIPSHTHAANVSSAVGTSPIPTGNSLAASNNLSIDDTNLTMLGNVVSNTGSQPHENMQPSCVVNFQIALIGLFPSRN
jgi:microcystin-dependent protein